jgi:ribosomal protein S18 acetylase RimI-like enzyme
VVIRPATKADVPKILALWRAAGAIPGATDDADAIEALIEYDADALLVADVDGALAGTVIGAWDGWRGNLYRLAVSPAHQRRGIATALTRAAEERLRRLGCRRVTALVAGSHDHAVAFWTSAGYEWQVDMRRYVR